MKRYVVFMVAMIVCFGFVSMPSYAWGKKKKEKVSLNIPKLKEKKAFIYNSHGKKDPMLPVVDSNGTVLFVQKKKTGETTVNIEIQGIIYKKRGGSKVMIGGVLYKEGDRIGMVLIKQINRDSVIVSDGQKDYTLEI